MAHSSRGLGHLPLKEEITGSNPVCATNDVLAPCFKAETAKQGASVFRFADNLLIDPFGQLKGVTLRLSAMGRVPGSPYSGVAVLL